MLGEEQATVLHIHLQARNIMEIKGVNLLCLIMEVAVAVAVLEQ